MKSSRRELLASLGTAAAALLAPWNGQRAPAVAASPNDRLRLGAIGLGGQGRGIAKGAEPFADVVACCDVDRSRAERFVAGRPIAVYDDFRKLLDRPDLDAVLVATPDHWHAAIVIRAVRSGKDVYCEKPLTHDLEECRRVCHAVQASGRIVQVGTQQRSLGPFLKALALAQHGRLGRLRRATCNLGPGQRGGPFPPRDPPPGLNWDFWLGPAPAVPYVPQRCHYNFRWWREYSGGKLTDWGAHHVDIAQWALGHLHHEPVRAEGCGAFPAGVNCYNTAVSFQARLTFADGAEIRVQHGPPRGTWFDPLPLPETPGCPAPGAGLDNGIWLEGDRGTLFVNRNKLAGRPVDALTPADEDWIRETIRNLYQGREPGNHMANFVQAVRDRRPPIADVVSHCHTLTSCHLANLAMCLGRPLTWDAATGDFLGDAEASALRSRTPRKGYTWEEMT